MSTMAAPPSDAPTPDDGPGGRNDWATTSIDRVVDVVERLRSATTQPAITAVRTVVHGVFVAFCLIAALVLGSIGIFRLLDVAIPGDSWSAHLALGVALSALGAWFWSRRTPRS
jgi:hypothetical protein|tara:strand:+ start:881 stop:1222 length:342 start_codon:yes stop_codon:yes gene_type:complete